MSTPIVMKLDLNKAQEDEDTKILREVNKGRSWLLEGGS